MTFGVHDSSVRTNKKLLNMAIEIVDFPIKNGDFPLTYIYIHNVNPGFC